MAGMAGMAGPLTVREGGPSSSHPALAATPLGPFTPGLSSSRPGPAGPAPGISGTGAWGSTSVGGTFGGSIRARTPLIALAIAASMLAGGLIAWSLSDTSPHPAATPVITLTGSVTPTAPTALPAPTVLAAPVPTVVVEASAAPIVSVASAASAAPDPSSAASAKARKAAGKPADPFGMERK